MSASPRLVGTPVIYDLQPGMVPAADGQAIGIGAGLGPEQVLRFATEFKFRHVCQRDGYAFAQDLRTAEVLAGDPDNFRRLPIASVLTPDDLSERSEQALIVGDEPFNRSMDKRPILDRFAKALDSKGFPQTVGEDVVLVADEMFTNAVYNAPFVDRKTQANPGISRHNMDVRFHEGKVGRLFLAHDEARLVVGCVDPFGSLNVELWLEKIRETYQRGPAATMNFGPGGAGLGSYIIFNAGCSLYFGVWPDEVTVLACVLPLGISNRKRVELPKHLHWIQR